MADSIFIQHRFTINRNGVSLTDALVYPKDKYDTLTPQEITALKEERYSKHVERIKNPPKPKEPTKEEQLAAIEKDLASIEEQKVTLTSLKTELQKPVKPLVEDIGGK